MGRVATRSPSARRRLHSGYNRWRAYAWDKNNKPRPVTDFDSQVMMSVMLLGVETFRCGSLLEVATILQRR